MTTQLDLVALRTRKPTAQVLLNGQQCRAIISLKTTQAFGSPIATATVVLRDPPVEPDIAMSVAWTWGYEGARLVPGFTGEICQPARKSYPNRYTLQCRDVLWRADRSNQPIQTDPLNEITASAAVRYILTHYGGIPASRISIPTFSASGSEWVGGEWTLGILTPVQWGDPDTKSGGISALKAAQEICSCLGFWLYADASGIIRAKQMDRAPSLSPAWTFRRGVDLLTEGSPELIKDIDAVKNRIIVLGGNTGVDGAQIQDDRQTSLSIIPSGVFADDTFSSFLIEYINASQAGEASAGKVAERILKVKSRLPIIVRHRVKANPMLSVGATVGIVDTGVGLATARNFFIYELETSFEAAPGKFDQQMTLDGGIGNSGYSTIPPPDASFSWRLLAKTADGDSLVEVFLDGSGSTSLTGGVIVSWAWGTSTTTYGGTPSSATGEHAVFFFLASEGTADIALVVTDTTSKTGTITQTIDLTGADTLTPISRVLSVALGAAWAITPDGGANWHVETSGGDAIAVGTIGAGADARAAGTGGTYGMLATRGSGGTGIRQTLDALATASTSLVAAGGTITSNIWVNEGNPARVWFAVGSTVYRSTDGGATETAMATAPNTVTWIQEDASVDNSVFILSGADMLNATDPTVGWATLYSGPVGSTARQFVRSRDGLVTWIAYTGAGSGEALQRVETGALADIAVTDIRTLALDREATGALATLWAITADDPAQIWSFDGLTGLDAAQSTPTFPAGATVMHMLADPEVDAFYSADFDSVTPGTGAVREFAGDQLLLYYAGASGQQAHMLGYGARVTAPGEYIWLTAGLDPVTAWHDRDGVWAARPLPVAGVGMGIWIATDPFGPSRWLAIINGDSHTVVDAGGFLQGDNWAYSPLWETEDAGLTWTPVPVPTPPGFEAGSFIDRAVFSDQTGNQWTAIMTVGSTYYTARVQGTGAVVTSIVETTDYSAPGIAAGADGDLILVDTFNPPDFNLDYLHYVDEAGAHTPAGTSPGNLARGIDRMPGLSRVVLVHGADGDELLITSDYRASQPIGSGIMDVRSVAGAVPCAYVIISGVLTRLDDPTGAQTQTPIGAGAGLVTDVRVDRQTRSRAAVGVQSAGGGTAIAAVITDDGTVTTTIAGPPIGQSGLSVAFDVLIRS